VPELVTVKGIAYLERVPGGSHGWAGYVSRRVKR